MFPARRPRLLDEDVGAIDQNIEQHDGGGFRGGEGVDGHRVLDVHAVLERLKARDFTIDDGDDLPVDYELALSLLAERSERVGDLGKLPGLVVAVAGDESSSVPGDESEDANAIILGLEGPALAVRHGSPDRGVHGLQFSDGPRGGSAGACLTSGWR